jgi:NAD(P)H-dependent flavin oxidoreductase YrpB (nitropropane dioxygenase family)
VTGVTGVAGGSEGSGSLRTPLCDLVGVEVPIVQTGMGWVSGARLTAATANAGALGILASATMDLDELRRAVGEVQRRAPDRSFGVNFRADQPDLADRLAFVEAAGVRVASFASPPATDVVTRLRDAGLVVVPTVGAPRHAVKMADIGVHAVIAQGMEGGGHTGDVPTSLLVPACVDALAGAGHADVAVIAAGGFHDGRGLVAALAWGAVGVAMGTRFLLSAESTVPDEVKARYLAAGLRDTVRTTAVDGHPQRVIRTELVDGLERASLFTRLPRAARNALRFRELTGTSVRDLASEGLAMRRNQELSWSQLAMAANAPMLTKAALVDGHPEVGVLPTGQVVGEIDSLPPVVDIVAGVMGEALETLAALQVMQGGGRSS